MRQTNEAASLTKSPAPSFRQSVAQHTGGCDGAGDLDGFAFAKPANPEWAGSLEPRFAERIQFQPDRCWVWTGAKYGNGYAQCSADGKRHLGHRYFYRRFVGEIPSGLECDHLCWVHSCVNPNHIELTTHRANKARQLLSIVVKLRIVRYSWQRLIMSVASLNGKVELTSTFQEISKVLLAFAAMENAAKLAKRCKICRRIKPTSDFYWVKDVCASLKPYGYFSSYCKPCQSRRSKEKYRQRRNAQLKELRNA